MKARSDWLSALTLMALTWLFLSPWVVKPFDATYAIDAWMVGTVTFVIIMTAMRPPRPALANFIGAALGAWMFLSPWVLGYQGKYGPALNSWIMGGIVAVLSFIAAVAALTADRSEQAAA